MNGQNIEEIGKVMGQEISQVSLAIIGIVIALKRQPGFDFEAFNNQIGSLLESAAQDREKNSTLIATLEAVLS